MFQQNINGNTMKGQPFFTADGWVWFRGTDDTLWRVFNDGSQQSNPGNNTTSSSPVVTADGWVWFQGTNNGLYRMRTDGSQRSTPGNNSCLDRPFVDAAGWVWFQGTNNGLNSMLPDGSEKSTPGNNSCLGRPFATADEWVWFRGTNDGLYSMRRDGSQRSTPGNNSTGATPTVTVDGWVWFRGTDNKLWRMFRDGTQQTQVDGNLTSSPLTVGPMSIASGSAGGVAGEWVYWRGTDDKLWRDFIPASALSTEVGQPAYYVLTVAYAPPGTAGPGSSSSVTYSSGSSTGTTTSTSKSFKAETEVGAGDEAKIGPEFKASTTTTDTSSLEITKSEGYSLTLPGPAKDGIDHDYDLFQLLLNPQVTATQYPQNVVLWSMGIASDTGTALIYNVYAGDLKNPQSMPAGTKKALDDRGLTQSDYDQILSTDPFAGGSTWIDPNRFRATPQSLPYSPPLNKNDLPVTTTYTVSSETTQTETHEVETEYCVGMEVSLSLLKDSNTLTWTSKNTAGTTTTSQQQANATVTGPSVEYGGPTTVKVYWDTLYSSFLFAFPTEPPSFEGTLLDESGQPVADELVTLTVGGDRFSTFTDGLGEYRFYGTPSGQGTIAVSHQVRVEVGGSEKLVTHLPRRHRSSGRGR